MPQADVKIPALIATSGARIPLVKAAEPAAAQAIYPAMQDILGRPNLAMLRRLAKSPWVRAAIRRRREQVSSAEWAIAPKDPTKRFNEAFAGELEERLRNPNPRRDSFRILIEPVIEDYLVVGQGAIEKEQNARRLPLFLYAVNAGNVRFESGWSGKDPNAPRYYYLAGGQKIPLRNDQLIVLLSDPATDRDDGLSTVAVLALSIEAELAGANWAHDHLRQMPPAGLLDLGQGATDRQVQSFRSYWASEVAGRSMAITGGTEGAKYTAFSSQSGKDLLAWNEYFVRKICTTFGLSPQDLGVTFDVNRATADVQADISRDAGLKPLLALIQEYLNREWLTDFGSAADNLEFKFTQLSETDQVGLAELVNLQNGGLPRITLNEARAEEGRDPIPGGDVIFQPTPHGALPFIGEGLPTPAEAYAMARQQAAQQDAQNTPEDDDGSDTDAAAGGAADAGGDSSDAGTSRRPGRGQSAAGKATLPALTKAAAPSYRASLAPMRRALKRGYATFAAERNAAIGADLAARLGLVKDATGTIKRDDLVLAIRWAIERAIVRERTAPQLAPLLTQAWLDSAAQRIADELQQLGRTQDVTLADPGLLATITQRATQTADAIGQTLLSDATEHVQADDAPDDYEDAAAAAGAVESYLSQRDGWKGGQIAISETQAAALFGLRQFATRNGLDGTGRCVPSDASCDTCGGFIDQGSVPLHEALNWDLPAHPHCPHDIETDYEPVPESESLWAG